MYLFLSLAICFSCQSASDTSVSVANDICSCFKPLVQVNTQIQTMLKNGQGNKAEDLLPKIDELQAEGRTCAANLVKKYGADTQLDTDKISQSMKESCPKIFKIVEQDLFSE